MFFSGMGFFLEKNEYIIVRIALFSGREFFTEVKIFSSVTNILKIVRQFKFETPMAKPGVFANGPFHWQILLDGKLSICAFNSNDACAFHQRYTLIKIPDEVRDLGDRSNMVALDDGRLVICCDIYLATAISNT